MSYSRLRRPLAAATLTGMVAASLTAVTLSAPAAQAADGDVTLNLLLTNDFHGRINDNTVRWAWNVENLRQTTPADGGLFVGAGDLIGASEFASAVDDDQPTIDVMNAMGLDASTVGNHEFDQGWHDLRDDVLEQGPGPDDDREASDAAAAWEYLGANVYTKGTTDPVLPEYYSTEIDGVTVAVVGAVTQETRTLVSPGGISELDFGDPVDAVNRVAGELSDGDDANGEADVIVATFHSGAAVGEGSTYEDELAKGGEFAEMANLDPAVNVVFNGHTHQTYAWDAPTPAGSDLPTRPFLQTGSYASNVGQVVLTYNTVSDAVTNYTVANHATPGGSTPTNAELIAQYPDPLEQVNQIVTAAQAYAAEIGNQPVGSITADITRAFKGGSYGPDGYTATAIKDNENRAAASTMGQLVANALRDGLPQDMGEPDLGITNPGGLRTDFLYEGDTSSNPENTDGVITYAEANNVLPFVNNIWTVDMTGAEIKQVLEQQYPWHPSDDGARTGFLQLGLSDNVQVTRDPSRALFDRITSIRIDGKPMAMDQTYTVCTFSFLGEGGDDFAAFSEGTSKDTGLVDRELWIQYLNDNPGIGPDFARQQVDEDGMPTTVSPGQSYSFSVGAPTLGPDPSEESKAGLASLNMTSLGSPLNTEVTVYAHNLGRDYDLGTFPVENGQADIELTVPGSVPVRSTLRVVASPSMTTVGKGESSSSIAAETSGTAYGEPGTIEASITPASATGTVTVWDGGQEVGSATLSGGSATVTVPGTAFRPGDHGLTVTYSGDDTNAPASTGVSYHVAKARPDMRVHIGPKKVVKRKTHPRIRVSMAAPGQTVRGRVVVRTGGDTYSKRLRDGRAVFRVGSYAKPGRKRVVVRYTGSSLNRSVREVHHIRVRRHR